MEHYAGIDVSLELSSVCVVDAKGKIVKGSEDQHDPVALVTFFRGLGIAIERIWA
jgi:transposase